MSQEILDFIWISVLMLIMCVLIGRMLVSYFIRAGKYGGIPPSSESREKYKLVISSKADNTVVWVVLYEGDNEDAIEGYGWELKGFMEKKIMAVRVE